MKIKYSVFTAVMFLLFALTVNAQETKGKTYKPDMNKFATYAKEAYGKEKAAGMGEMTKASFGDLFEKRLVIAKLKREPKEYSEIADILAYNEELKQKKDFDPKTFNPFNYNLNYWNRENKEYYKVGDTGYYIIIEKYKSTTTSH